MDEKSKNQYRRRFLQGVGAAGIGGVLAGCTGGDDNGDDDNGEENGGENGNGENGEENGNGNGENGDEPEPAYFAVADLSAIDVTRGETATVSATIENTGEQEGTQEVAFAFDGEEMDSTEQTLEGGASADVSFDVETADFEPDDYEYEVATGDESDGGTLSVGALEPDDPLLAFDGDVLALATGSNAITATLTNPYPVALTGGEVTVDVPEGWEVTDQSGASFDELGAEASQEAEWTLSVPEDADGESELTFEVSYTAGGEEADVEPVTQAVNVIEFQTSPDPVHHWPMDEGEGETVADAVGEEDGTLDGTDWVEPDWTDGAAVENAGQDTVQLTELDEFVQNLNGNFAVAYTIESEDTSDEAGVLSARDGNGSGPGWAVLYSNGWFGVSQGVGMTLHDGTGDGEESTIVTSEDGILDGGPHRVVINKVTNDSEAWEIYVDGRKVESEVPLWNGEFPANNFDGLEELPTNVRLFNHDLGDRHLEGVLDDLQLFDAPLAESAVGEDFEQQPWSDEVEAGEQFYWSADGYDVGENPEDSWEPIGVDEWDVQEDDDGQYMTVGGPAESTSHVRFDDAPEATDVEVYATIKPIGTWSDHWAFVRDPDPTEEDAEQFRADTNFAEWTEAHVLQGFDEGEHGSFGDIPLVPDEDEPYHLRFQYRGDILRAKWWLTDEDEPDEWDLEAEPDTEAQAGYTGIGRWNGDPFHVYEFGVGIDGASAPAE